MSELFPIASDSAAVEATVQAMRRFVDERVIPAEARLCAGGAPAAAAMAELSAQARAERLWGLHFPQPLGGTIALLQDYVHVAEEEGRSEAGPMVFGGEVTLDAHMLWRHGSPRVKDRCLAPLVEGHALPSYGMSEPDSVGSDPATIRTRAERRDGGWILNGRKWFISRADQAAFVTVVARTGERAHPPQLGMFVVPTDAPGFRLERQQSVLGRLQGQGEMSFTDAAVPDDHLLGAPDGGLRLMQQRLGIGRLLRSAHWLGLARRCFELMCARIDSPRGELAQMSDKQLVRARVFETYRQISSARALVRAAAARVDAGLTHDIDVNLAKVSASHALVHAVDQAIQVFGAEGVSDESPLSWIYRSARATRILDGTDDALISAVARRLLSVAATDRTKAGNSSATRRLAA